MIEFTKDGSMEVMQKIPFALPASYKILRQHAFRGLQWFVLVHPNHLSQPKNELASSMIGALVGGTVWLAEVSEMDNWRPEMGI